MYVRSLLSYSAILMPFFCATLLRAAPLEILPSLSCDQSESAADNEADFSWNESSIPASGTNYFLGSAADNTTTDPTKQSPFTASSTLGDKTTAVSTSPSENSKNKPAIENSAKSTEESGSFAVIPEPGMTVLLLSSLFGGSLYAGRILRRKVIAVESDHAPRG